MKTSELIEMVEKNEVPKDLTPHGRGNIKVRVYRSTGIFQVMGHIFAIFTCVLESLSQVVKYCRFRLLHRPTSQLKVYLMTWDRINIITEGLE